MIHGSVTSIGVAYPRELPVQDLARHVRALLGTVLEAPRPGRWPLRLSGGREGDVLVELEIKDTSSPEETIAILERFLGSEHGEIEAVVQLAGVGAVDAVLRPETAVCGLLLDLPDAALYPSRDHRRSAAVVAAIKELLLAWHDASRFAVAFADHEAEFHVDPLDLGSDTVAYALVALPSARAGGVPLDFRSGGWPLALGGA